MAYDSPFPPNATLLFSQPEPLLVAAYLNPAGGNAQFAALEAGGVGSIALKGRAVSPLALPNTLQPDQEAAAILWRVSDASPLPEFASVAEYEDYCAENQALIQQEGRFFLQPITTGVWGVEEVLGQKLQGYLQAAVIWTDSP